MQQAGNQPFIFSLLRRLCFFSITARELSPRGVVQGEESICSPAVATSASPPQFGDSVQPGGDQKKEGPAQLCTVHPSTYSHRHCRCVSKSNLGSLWEGDLARTVLAAEAQRSELGLPARTQKAGCGSVHL